MNPIDPLLLFMFSPSVQTVWGAKHRAPDDEHPNPWLPDWITASWPPDTREGPQHPSNLPGYDSTKNYDAVFSGETMEWVEVPWPPAQPSNAEEPVNGDS